MRTFLRGKVTLLFMTFGLLLALPAIALADIAQNNVVEIEGAKTKYVKPGVSTSVSYFIQVEGTGVDGQAGCNAADGSAATVTLNVPANVTTNDADNKLTFSQCNAGNSQSVNFSSNTEGTYNITASVSDSGTGSYTNSANWTLVVDGTAPEVDSTDPANGATGVAVDKDFIKATFDEKVDPATISGSTFSLTGPSGAVGGTVTYDAATKTAKFDPTGNLAQNTVYTATLEGGATGSVVKDYAGNALASDYSWSFRTFNPNNEPVLTVPSTITAEATSSAGAAVSFTGLSATDTEDGNLTSAIQCTPASGSTFALGNTTVNCSVTDSGGLSDSGSFTVTVVDTTAPELTLPGNITREATGPNGAAVTYSATASDLVDGNMGDADCTPASGATFPIDTTTVECSATDAAGNTATDSFTVTVQDTTAPELTLPGNITREATGPSGAAVTYSATASDLVDGNMGDADCTPASGATFPITTTTVNCSATDAAGNEATGSFTVKVQDTAGPVLSLPANITTTATSNSKATVNFTATANDVVDGSRPVSCNPASGSLFSAGTTTVNCSSTDSRGNTSNGSFTVTVNYGWSGFFRPVDNPDTVNSVKAGSAIPVKFSLAGNQGLNIFAANFPASQKITCDTSDPVDLIEETVTAGGSSLSYDSSLDQYNYVWKTDKAWAGTCRQLTVKTADGTPHIAIFKFLK
jgi:Bacterial Ig-like domain/HYR domain